MVKGQSRQSSPPWMLGALAFLLCCLVAHFLVEDLVLYANPPGLAPAARYIGELTHQDDQAIVMGLPEQMTENHPVTILPVVLPSEAQAVLPILQPPKI